MDNFQKRGQFSKMEDQKMDNFEEIDIFKNGHFQNYGQFGKMQMDNF